MYAMQQSMDKVRKENKVKSKKNKRVVKLQPFIFFKIFSQMGKTTKNFLKFFIKLLKKF